MSIYGKIESNVVVNTEIADADFAQQFGLILMPEGVGINWRYIDGEFLPPLPPDYSQQNKDAAITLLQETDWTCTVDINNPQYSNPYLTNQNEFLEYRSIVRAVAVNPPTELVTFPQMPQEQWSS